MAKIRTRRLWIGLRYDIPKNVSEEKILRTLRRSITRGDYELPKGWRVAIEWRNKQDAPMKRGAWKPELEASAESSPGFDLAMLRYLDGQLDRIENG
jgi:hypothetical protein